MISCILRGQLGNQMFQVAATVSHALDNDTDYGFPRKSGKREQFDFMFPHLPTADTNDILKYDSIWVESNFGIYIPIPSGKNQLLKGYFQSEDYFKHNKDFIIEKCFSNIPRYQTQFGKVGLHVRRGDYLRWSDKLPQPPEKYFTKALDIFERYKKIVIFTDDLDWCKQNFKGDRFDFDESDSAIEAMARMASMEHNIIVNSTFSWWGAYLNSNPNKIIVAPHSDSWFGQNWKHKLSAQDIVPESWIKINY